MLRASVFLTATSFLALAACGGETDNELAADNAYDTIQPELPSETGVTDEMAGVGDASVASTPAAPLPDVITGDIIDVAQGAGDFTTLVSAIESAGLTARLEGPGPFTVFAPTDEAFAALPEGALDELMQPANKEKLVALVEYHVLPSRVTSEDVAKDVPSPATVQGAAMTLETTEDGKVMAGDAHVVTPDIMATNGVVHIVDKVLMPPEG